VIAIKIATPVLFWLAIITLLILIELAGMAIYSMVMG
jgi:hypothetical protein